MNASKMVTIAEYKAIMKAYKGLGLPRIVDMEDQPQPIALYRCENEDNCLGLNQLSGTNCFPAEDMHRVEKKYFCPDCFMEDYPNLDILESFTIQGDINWGIIIGIETFKGYG